MLIAATMLPPAFGDTIRQRDGKEFNGKVIYDGRSFSLTCTEVEVAGQAMGPHQIKVHKKTLRLSPEQVARIEFNDRDTCVGWPQDKNPHGSLGDEPRRRFQKCKKRNDTVHLFEGKSQTGELARIKEREIEVKADEGAKGPIKIAKDQVSSITIGRCD
jgi:hypothetical protein